MKGEGVIQKIFQSAASKSRKKLEGLTIAGLKDIVFIYAKCCEPLPGDDVVGYVTRGRGVVVHRRDCHQILSADEQRLLEVAWVTGTTYSRVISIEVRCLDKLGMLALITQAISSCGASIMSAHSVLLSDGKATNTFGICIKDAQQLECLRRMVEGVDGVIRLIVKNR